jgi:hypothetical protein
MGIVNQYTDGEYVVTEYDNGAIERVINQAGKSYPAVVEPVNPLADVEDKLRIILDDLSVIKAQIEKQVKP